MSGTRKLYYEDVMRASFQASVTETRQKDGVCHVSLDQTAFYPEGGGQPSDTGALGGTAVTDVYEENGRVWHVLEGSLAQGAQVEGRVDWPRRIHYMQQHLGQHILSAVLAKEMDVQTLSVHFGPATSTLDTDKPLDAQAMERAERLANDAAYQNIPVETLFPPLEEIERRTRKRPPDTGEPIRIVKIGDLDYSACCGTHCTATGQAGPIKLWKQESYKGGSRLTFSCGNATLDRFRAVWDQAAAAGKLLSCGETELCDRVRGLTEEVASLKKQNRKLLDEQADALAQELLSAAEQVKGLLVISHIVEDTTQDALKRLHGRLTAQDNAVALLGGSGVGEAYLMLGCGKGVQGMDLRPALQEGLALIGGKGGGGPTFAQGKGTDPGQLKAAVAEATAAVIKQIENS